MALTKEKKNQVIDEVSELLAGSKLVVMAKYPGTSVQALQQLRRDARQNGTVVRVIKNRLFKKALSGNERFGSLDSSLFQGQLLYAFSDSDEVAPAQSLASFAKEQPQLEFVAGIDADGNLLSADDLKMLASLPTKDQLRGQLVGLIASPLSGLVGVMNANLRSVLNVMEAHAEELGTSQ